MDVLSNFSIYMIFSVCIFYVTMLVLANLYNTSKITTGIYIQMIRFILLFLIVFLPFSSFAEDAGKNTVAHLQNAANRGNPEAQRLLGSLYYNAQGVPKDDAKAVEWWQKAAAGGDSQAQVMLGAAYHDGLGGLEKDDKQAISWWNKAADKGDPEAQFNLAGAYHEGIGGLKRDDKQAIAWYQKAANQGDSGAQFNLGIAYYRGMGVDKNLQNAVGWFSKAAEAGDAQSQYILAAAYQNGMGGMPKDSVQAYKWLIISHDNGDKEADESIDSMKQLMTADEVSKGQQLATEWESAHPSAK